MKRLLAVLTVGALLMTLLGLDYSKTVGGSYVYYVTHWRDVGVPNLVTAILADWRAYDSLGEVAILFAAITGFSLILEGKARWR